VEPPFFPCSLCASLIAQSRNGPGAQNAQHIANRISNRNLALRVHLTDHLNFSNSKLGDLLWNRRARCGRVRSDAGFLENFHPPFRRDFAGTASRCKGAGALADRIHLFVLFCFSDRYLRVATAFYGLWICASRPVLCRWSNLHSTLESHASSFVALDHRAIAQMGNGVRYF